MHTKAPVVLNSTASHHAPALDETWSCWMDQEEKWMLEFEIEYRTDEGLAWRKSFSYK
jgi:hypothetical protein